jgi:hypothetical protein
VARSNLTKGKKTTRAAFVFGFGGLVSGIIYQILASSSLGRLFFPVQPLSRLPLFLFWPGSFFLIAMGLSLIICQNLRWINVRLSWGRFVAAALLLVITSFCAALAGLFSGFATAALEAGPILMRGDRLVRPAHPMLYDAIPVAIGLLFGLLVGAMLVSLAAYALTQSLNVKAWRSMLVCVVVIAAATIAAYPAFFGIARPVGARQSYLNVFKQVILSLHMWGYMSYGACCGYWLAAGQREDEIGACSASHSAIRS